MNFEIFLNFNDGRALAAAEFYAGVFKSEVRDIMRYSDVPADSNYPIRESDRDRIMYATVKIGDKNIMFMDMSDEYRVAVGGNINPCVVLKNHAEIDRIVAELSADGGKVIDAPGKTFFSEYYGMVADKFGITWHVYMD